MIFKRLTPLERANKNKQKRINKEVKELLRACKKCARRMIKNGEITNGIPYFNCFASLEAKKKVVEVINNGDLYYTAGISVYPISGNYYIRINIKQ